MSLRVMAILVLPGLLAGARVSIAQEPSPTPQTEIPSPSEPTEPAPPEPTPEESATPSPTPTATPIADLRIPLFLAVAECEPEKIKDLLSRGVDINAPLPHPAPEELAKRFTGTKVEFYITNEPGLTPLMLASAMGYADVVDLLIANGADPHKKTERNKTFALWLAAKFQHVDVMRILMGISPESEAARTRIRVSLKEQRAYLWRDGGVVTALSISSGREKFPTPTGKYLITDKYREWKSTIYRVKMPYFLRLSCGDFGLHAGYLPGYPASHGCIRMPEKEAKELFATVPIGTLVEIE